MNLTPIPLNVDTQVNTYTEGWQRFSSVTALAEGDFVVTWSSVQGGSGWGIYGQRYDSAGEKAGAEFHVNTYTSSNQNYSSATSLLDGGFVVTWTSNQISAGGVPGGSGIYGQRYDSAGEKAGVEFHVSTFSISDQEYSSVTSLSDGGFVVTWESFRHTYVGSSIIEDQISGIYGQRYNSAGEKAGVEFHVNTYTINDQEHSSVTSLSEGGFVVTWTSNNQTEADGALEDQYQGIYGQRYDSAGEKAGVEFHVNTYTINDQNYSSVTWLLDGGFVVTWSSWNQDGTRYGIYGKRYDALGSEVERFDENNNALGSEFQVNSYSASSQYYSSVTSLSDGGFVVTWSSKQDVDNGVSSYGIYGQRYDNNGHQVGGEFRLNDTTEGLQFEDTLAGNTPLATLSDGRLVATWASAHDDEVFFRLIDVPSMVPNPPIIEAIRSDTGSSASDGITSDNTLLISGTAEAFLIVEVLLNGTAIGTTITAADGSWLFDYTRTELADGNYTVTAISTDSAGNESAASADFDLTIITASSGEVIVGTSRVDMLVGGTGDDEIYGRQGDDYLSGDQGEDYLSGDDGDDKLFGGDGEDFLRGGEGKDSFIFTDYNDSQTGNADRIADFESGQDLLDFTAIAGAKFDAFTIRHVDGKTLLSNNEEGFLLTFNTHVDLTQSDFDFA